MVKKVIAKGFVPFPCIFVRSTLVVSLMEVFAFQYRSNATYMRAQWFSFRACHLFVLVEIIERYSGTDFMKFETGLSFIVIRATLNMENHNPTYQK